MPKFSKRSEDRLMTCDPQLILLFNRVIKDIDCTILCGHREKREQQKAYNEKKSKVQYPNSKHNKYPSLAVDVAPYPIDWEDLKRFYYFAGYVKGVAQTSGIKIRVGADWDGDFHWKDQNFHDLPHFELVE